MKKWAKNLIIGAIGLSSVIQPKSLSANSLEKICSDPVKKEVSYSNIKKSSDEIYSIVRKVQPELFRELKNTYIAYEIDPVENGDTLILNYKKGAYDKRNNTECGIASGILKRLLEKEGLNTEYVVLSGEENTPWKDDYDFYNFEGENKNISANHVFLKTGDVYIDPTWWQFFDYKNKNKDRIAVGTEEELKQFYSNFKLKEEWDFNEEYFDSFSDPRNLDPNHLEEYAAALFAEKSSDKKIKIPITGYPEVDCSLELDLDFFKKFSLREKPKNYSVINENFAN